MCDGDTQFIRKYHSDTTKCKQKMNRKQHEDIFIHCQAEERK